PPCPAGLVPGPYRGGEPPPPLCARRELRREGAGGHADRADRGAHERGPVREGGHVRDGRGVRRHPRPHGRDGLRRQLVDAMDFSFSPAELRFAAEARGWLEANLPAAWRRDHCWTRVEEPLWLEVARAWQ